METKLIRHLINTISMREKYSSIGCHWIYGHSTLWVSKWCKTFGKPRVLHDFDTPRVEWPYIQWQPIKEKKKEIWPSPMTKPPIPTENSKTKGQHTQRPPKTSITQRLRTDLGRSVGVTSNPTGVVKPVYGIPTFPLTAKAV